MVKIQLQKIKKSKKRVGRGQGSGCGKTSGRGMSGQKSRAGAKTYFKEGGQTSIMAKLPKASKLKPRPKRRFTVTAESLSRAFKPKEEITLSKIIERFSVKGKITSVKVIGNHQKLDFKFGEGIVLSKSQAKNNG